MSSESFCDMDKCSFPIASVSESETRSRSLIMVPLLVHVDISCQEGHTGQVLSVQPYLRLHQNFIKKKVYTIENIPDLS